MKLSELKDALNVLGSSHDDLDVILRVTDDDGMGLVGDLFHIAIDSGCTDTNVLMLDGCEAVVDDED